MFDNLSKINREKSLLYLQRVEQMLEDTMALVDADDITDDIKILYIEVQKKLSKTQVIVDRASGKISSLLLRVMVKITYLVLVRRFEKFKAKYTTTG
jgi:hypothetical protein